MSLMYFFLVWHIILFHKAVGITDLVMPTSICNIAYFYVPSICFLDFWQKYPNSTLGNYCCHNVSQMLWMEEGRGGPILW